jgi:CRP-like cAMP-binding protein
LSKRKEDGREGSDQECRVYSRIESMTQSRIALPTSGVLLVPVVGFSNATTGAVAMSPTANARCVPVNHLLACLPGIDRRRLMSRCDEVELVESEVLSERGDRIDHVYFPTSGFISLITPIDRQAGFEVGMVGQEGMCGVSLALGVDRSPQRALVQGAGTALRIKAGSFRRQLAHGPSLRRLLNRYVYVLMAQMAQAGACTRFHLLEARVARCLLMTHDRARGDTFHLTQVFLGYMLGMRREGITAAAGALQKKNLITYSRGTIRIVDRAGLEAASCACYRIDSDAYTGMLGG